jgi:uncharacterized damage-inducible protein DinB
MTPDTFPTLAQWTGWANRRIFAACAQLSPAEYFQARACAFGSIHRTLNHLLATDRVWCARLAGTSHDIPSLDYEVCPDFNSLQEARFEQDARIVELVTAIAAKSSASDILAFNSLDGTPRRMPLYNALSQIFLHHSHHRGQVHALLSQTSVTPPALDLTYFPGAAA